MKVIILSIALVFAHTAWSGDFEDGVAALERKDYATAFTKFRSAAQQGNKAAQYNLGTMYKRGEGVAQDYKEAVRWYRLAAQQGHAQAQYELGVMFEEGEGVAQDYKEALRFYKLVAKQGYAEAQFNLALLYAHGYGVIQNNIRAHMWFNISAAKGNKTSRKNRDEIANQMTPQQIEQAQRMARECMASNFTKCD